MGKITVELNIPDDVLRRIDLDTVRRMVEREIEIEYVARKLHGKFRGINLRELLREVEEEWTV